MHIKNIKIVGLHGISKSYDFTNHNYLFGRNGAGKSTVMQAIQFCLLGYIPGTNKTKDAILKHATMGTISVTIQIGEQEADYEITRTISSNGNDVSVNRLNSNAPAIEVADLVQDIELPIFNFDEFVGQTSNKLKDYFIKHILPVSNGKIEWGEVLSQGVSDLNFIDKDNTLKYGLDLISDVIADINSTSLDQVVEANKIFKEDMSFHKSEIARLQNTVDSLIYYDDYTGPTDIAEIESSLLSYRAIRDALIKYESAMQTHQSTLSKIEKLRSQIHDIKSDGLDVLWASQLDECSREMHALESEMKSMNVRSVANVERINYLKGVMSSAGVCPYTKEMCDSINPIKNQYSSEYDILIEAEQTLSAKYNEAKQSMAICTSRKAELSAKLSEYTMMENQLKLYEDSVMDLPQKPNTDLTLFELDNSIKLCEDNKMKVMANTQYNSTIEKLTKLKYESELRLNALKAWTKVTDTNGMQTTLMVTPFNDLANKMTTYIQTMYGRTDISAHFNVSTKANSFSFGLNRNGVYIPYDMLSSGEKCLYVIALMICITYNSKSPLKLIMIDDALDHLDDIAADSTFNAIKLINDVQFIMAGVKDCPNSSSMKINV